MATDSRTDVVIVGGGHNGLVAAGYLARAGRRVCVLERLDHVGGAAVSVGTRSPLRARGPVIAKTTPPNITMKPMTDRIGKLPIMVALTATPATSIARPSTNRAAPCRRRRVEGARKVPPRTLEANLGSSA